MRYYAGDVVPQSFTNAVELFSLAAEQGQANAQNCLGIMYMGGKGVETSYEKGFQFHKQAADQGLPNALRALGSCYQNGWGVEKSLEKAGEGVKKDYEKAIHFFTVFEERREKKPTQTCPMLWEGRGSKKVSHIG